MENIQDIQTTNIIRDMSIYWDCTLYSDMECKTIDDQKYTKGFFKDENGICWEIAFKLGYTYEIVQRNQVGNRITDGILYWWNK